MSAPNDGRLSAEQASERYNAQFPPYVNDTDWSGIRRLHFEAGWKAAYDALSAENARLEAALRKAREALGFRSVHDVVDARELLDARRVTISEIDAILDGKSGETA